MKLSLKKILAVLTKKERSRFFKLIAWDVVISILDIAFLVMLLSVINFYTQSNHILSNTSVALLLQRYPLIVIIVFFILFSAKNFAGYIVYKNESRFVYNVASAISKKNLLKYLEGDFMDYVNTDSSVYTRRISYQPIEFAQYVLRGVQQIISQSILIVLTVVAILIYNPVLFTLLFLILVPPVLLISLLLKRKTTEARTYTKTTGAKALQHLQEALSSFVESNMYDKNNFFTNRYYTFQKKLNHYLSQQQVIQNMPSRLIEVFAIFGLFILIVIHSYATPESAINIITLGAFMAAAYKIIPGIVKILNSIGQVKMYGFTVNDLTPQATKLDTIPPNTDFIKISSVELNIVSFSYEQPVLDEFNFKLQEGDFACIVGMSGRGKTTIIHLMLGFLTPDNGSVLVNGKVMKAEDITSFRKRVSYVKQQSFLIHDSIIKNITLEDAGFDEKKLSEVMMLTGIDKLTETFSDGLQTIITENGKNLSGGQRQRIVLSRALYKEFDVLILDEPFNELDEESEYELLKHLQKISQAGKIVVLVTHNKSALSFCNKTVLLDER